MDRRQNVGGTCYSHLQGTALLYHHAEDGKRSDCTPVPLMFYTKELIVITYDLLHNSLLLFLYYSTEQLTGQFKQMLTQFVHALSS